MNSSRPTGAQMKLYHTTIPERAKTIRSEGFCDTRDNYGLMHKDGAPFHICGVFFSDKPLGCENGLLPGASHVFVIEIPDEIIEPYEIIEEGKGYREWCIPARVANEYLRPCT